MTIVSMKVSSLIKLGLWEKVAAYRKFSANEKQIFEKEGGRIISFDDDFSDDYENKNVYLFKAENEDRVIVGNILADNENQATEALNDQFRHMNRMQITFPRADKQTIFLDHLCYQEIVNAQKGEDY